MDEFTPLDQLFQSPREWQSLFGEAPCGYLLTAPNGRIHLINDTLLDWLNYNREEVEKEMRFQEFLPPGERIFYESRHAVMLKLQKQVNELNYNFIGKDGIRHPMLVNSTRRLNRDGDIIAFQFVIFSFSDRKKYEEELLTARKKSDEIAAARSNFLSIVSHEVRTPIHAIINSIELLIQDDYSEEQQELMEVIYHSSSNLLDFVNAVLNITKMEAGSAVLIKEPFDIDHLLNQLLIVYYSLAQKKGIEFKLNYSENIPKFLIGDKNSLRQVLTNLIGNAIKFTQKGVIELSVFLLANKNETCTLQFVVKDTGIGMSKEELQKIFDPFTQANLNIHQEYGGTGLGLSISKQILQLLNSDIKAESQVGIGSVFTFELEMPISKEIVLKEELIRVSAAARQFNHLKILLVDDLYTNILILKRYFELWGIPFDHVFSGKDAIDKIKNEHYDLIMMDINMPEMDGYQASAAIRALKGDRFNKIPIIALSAFDKSEIKFKVRRSGMNGTLQKPFTSAQLYEAIIKWTPTIEKESGSQHIKQSHPIKSQVLDKLSLKKVCELFEGDQFSIKEYLKNVIIEVKESIAEFAQAKEESSLDIYLLAIHRNASKIGMFDLQVLKQKMDDGKVSLKKGKNELFNDESDEIIKQLKRFVNWLQEKNDKEEAICFEL